MGIHPVAVRSVLGGYGRGDLLRRFVGDVDGAQEGLVRAVVPSAGALGAVTLAAALSPTAWMVLTAGLLTAGIVVPAIGFRLAGSSTRSAALIGDRDRAGAGLVESLAEVVAYGGAGLVVDEVVAADVEIERATRRPSGAAGLSTIVPGLSPLSAWILRGAGFAVRAGERVAVVGPSGSGKSTLLTAALRLLPLSRGALELSGDDQTVGLCNIRARDLALTVAGSLQGDHVFDSTLRDNVRVVRPTASDAELDAIAERVGLLAMVRALPAGWSTPAGPDGAALSGGQRQRLLVARALLADPDILILDEPTAHLDAASERLVLDDLLTATSGRTVLMTTHRRITHDHQVEVIRLVARGLAREEIEGHGRRVTLSPTATT